MLSWFRTGRSAMKGVEHGTEQLEHRECEVGEIVTEDVCANASASGPKGTIVAASGNGAETVASCDDPRRCF